MMPFAPAEAAIPARGLPQRDLDEILDRAAEQWRLLAGTRWFITGGTGLIGSWLLRAIAHANERLDCGIRVVVLSRNADRAKIRLPFLVDTEGFFVESGDVRSFERPVEPFDVCVHAATDVADPVRAADHLAVFDANVSGTRRVMEYAAQCGVRRLLLTSSGAVYGRQPVEIERIPETYEGAADPLIPANAYAISKRAAEWLAIACGGQAGIEVKIARIYALIGPSIPLDGPFAAGNFIANVLAGRNIEIHGDGSPLRSYLYMSDACVWLLRILIDGMPGQAYNVGSETAVSIRALAEAVIAASGKPLQLDVRQPVVHGRSPARYIPDTAKARNTLNLAEYTPFATAVERTLLHFQSKHE
ncbi:MAG: NAD(P)-dependent oxidoreductase [Nevskia sp.]